MSQAATYAFAYHQLLVLIAGSVCLFGTWVGMRHFARARATVGTTRLGWLFMASVGTGAALWASTFISILALDPILNSGFEPVATGAVSSSPSSPVSPASKSAAAILRSPRKPAAS